MADRWREEGDEKKAFAVARQRIGQLAKEALTANSPQRLKLVTLSNLNSVEFNDRLNDQTLAELNKKLEDLQPSMVHVKPIEAVKWARGQIGQTQEQQRFLHFVSDLRDSDWSGSEADNLNKEIDGLIATGTRVLLLDVAHPYRNEKQPVALNHDNMGISDLRPETRFAAEGMPVQFTLVMHNFSPAERKAVFLDVRVNGEVRFEASQPIDIKPGETRHTFLLAFNKAGYNQVTVALTGEDAGLAEDNTRYAVVEVRKQLPVLLIDGSDETSTVRHDSFFLSTVLTAARGYLPIVKTPRDLDDLDLGQYPCLYLLNVGQFSEKAVKKLEEYVSRGGRLAFFLGDKVRSTHYNEVLYRNGQGLFPVPLAARPSDKVEPEEKLRRQFEDQYQIYIRAANHPIFEQIAQPQYREIFKCLMIDQYWPTLPRFQWNVDPAKVKELVTLPNRKSVDDYRARAAELNNQLPLSDERYTRFQSTLQRYQRRIRDALAGEYLYTLGNALEALLNDRGDSNNPEKYPDLADFWALAENQKLRAELNTLREMVQYGEPLVVTGRFGRGQTVAFLTTAGRGWNDWAGGCLASGTYPVVMLDLQKYLTGVGDESSYMVGAPLEVQLDATRYEPAARGFRPQPATKEAAAKPVQPLEGKPEDLPGKIDGTQLTFSFPSTRMPGIYYLQMQPKPETGVEPAAAPRPEERAYVFNVDTDNEGNLKRATREGLEWGGSAGSAAPDRGRVTVVTLDMSLRDQVAPKRKDMSESPWLYLFILLVLIVEQALAVHLSFHLKGSEAMFPGQRGASTGRPVPSEAA
jgi:hypothetical protein